METTPFDLTPEQKGLLASLARETGKPIPVLLAEALEELQEHVHPKHVHHPTNGGRKEDTRTQQDQTTKHIWDIAAKMLQDVPKEALDRLPTDGAAQHDHYIYGTPKRPA